MAKKLVIFCLSAIMLPGVIALTACNNNLDEYKEIGKAQIEAHVAAKVESEYSDDNWSALLLAADSGKQSIDKATDKAGVDTAVEAALAAMDKIEKGTLIEVAADEMIKLHTWLLTSGVPNNAITFEHSDKSAAFECAVDYGQFGFGTDAPKTVVAKSGETIYWSHTEPVEQAFVKIVVKLDDNVVGYAVIKIQQNISGADHNASIVKSVEFPKINGEFQSVKEEQVQEMINQIITDNAGTIYEN